jgi:hypothetical protein
VAPEKYMIKQLALVLSMTGATVAMAEGHTCNAAAAEKNLSGLPRNSFLEKCEKDAKATCANLAKDKKLYGIARTNFEKKCVADAVGEPKPAK